MRLKMNLSRRVLIILLILVWINPGAFPAAERRGAGDLPFTRGVNLTDWLYAPSARQIQFTKFTKQDFVNIKSLGCDVIRLPIRLHSMTDGPPDYVIDPLLFYFLDQIIDWAEELEIHLILDNHSGSPGDDGTPPGIIYALIPVWTQMAQRYKDRSTYIYYEVFNEPHGISDAKWNAIQQEVVRAIRNVDQTHTIIVGPAGWNSYNHLDRLPTSRPLAVVERHANRAGSRHADGPIGDRGRHVGRLVDAARLQDGKPDRRLDQVVVGRQVGVRAVLAEAEGAAIDQARIKP